MWSRRGWGAVERGRGSRAAQGDGTPTLPPPPPPSWDLGGPLAAAPLWDRREHQEVPSPRSQGAGFVRFYSSCLTSPYLVIKRGREKIKMAKYDEIKGVFSCKETIPN